MTPTLYIYLTLSWVLCGCTIGLVALRLTRGGDRGFFYGCLGVICGVRTFMDIFILSIPADAAIDIVLTILCLYLWWNNRKKGGWKKTAKELGDKSRARIQAMAKKMTPSPLLPSPTGA